MQWILLAQGVRLSLEAKNKPDYLLYFSGNLKKLVQFQEFHWPADLIMIAHYEEL